VEGVFPSTIEENRIMGSIVTFNCDCNWAGIFRGCRKKNNNDDEHSEPKSPTTLHTPTIANYVGIYNEHGELIFVPKESITKRRIVPQRALGGTASKFPEHERRETRAAVKVFSNVISDLSGLDLSSFAKECGIRKPDKYLTKRMYDIMMGELERRRGETTNSTASLQPAHRNGSPRSLSTVKIESPDGQLVSLDPSPVEHLYDGTIRVKRPDGTIHDTLSNGTVRTMYPNGDIREILLDGTERITKKKPSTVEVEGSMETVV
jgi:hypothetical protein